jgi:hypothetical protein
MIHLDVMHKASMKFTARLVRREIRKRHTRARRENHRMSGQEEKRVQTRYAPPHGSRVPNQFCTSTSRQFPTESEPERCTQASSGGLLIPQVSF